MTQEIAEEIEHRQKKSKAYIAEVHGQEGAQPDTAPGAPTEDELRATPEDAIETQTYIPDTDSPLSEVSSGALNAMELDA